jgi:hypothetical protein
MSAYDPKRTSDFEWHFSLAAARRKVLGFSHDSAEENIFAYMVNILENVPSRQEEPKLIVRKAPHAAVWSVWAVLEGAPSEEIFEGSSEEEASNWINTGGQAWLKERRRKRIS